MPQARRQLSLFLRNNFEIIENIRAKYNPVQHDLIAAHVTLCREDEIEQLEQIIENIKAIKLGKPISIQFGAVERFDEGKGVFIPAKGENIAYFELRKLVLGASELSKEQQPHITLIHPRNGTCTAEIFAQIQAFDLPTELDFDSIRLIEQKEGSKWENVQTFLIRQESNKRVLV